MIEVILVPKDRIGVVKSEKNKEMIEKELGIKIRIVDNSVEIEGEGLNLMVGKNMIKAIARGFSPERAMRLKSDEVYLEIIDLKDFNEGRINSIKSRVIGTKGRTREAIEEKTKAYISVYGKTISIIGSWKELKNAKEAIEMLISGIPHETVYKFLDRLKV